MQEPPYAEIDIRGVLRNRPAEYRRLSTIEPVFDEIRARGIFSTEGETWHRQRQLVMPAFNNNQLCKSYPLLARITERLRRRWDLAADAGHPVEVQKDLMRYMVDVTANLVLGYDLNVLEAKESALQQHLERVFPMANRRINAPFPYWRYIRLPADRALDHSLEEIGKIVLEIISASRKRLETDPEAASSARTLLDAMIIAGNEDGTGARFSDEEIFGNVLTMLLAGQDTTANSMAWMIHFMIDYPEVQARMRREADEILGTEQIPIDFQDIAKLRYIEAAVRETMRLKSVAPVLFLEANENVELKRVRIPKGTAILLLTQHGAQQESHFECADSFSPERWLTCPEAPSVAHDPKSSLPFGSGPRFCPGRTLALLAIKTVMAMICRNFVLSKPDNSGKVRDHFAFTMMPANLFANFSKREGS